MTLNMHARLTADGKQAQAELAKTGQGARGLKTEVDALGQSGQGASTDFMALQKQMQAYKVDLVNLGKEHAAAKKQIDALRGELTKLKAKAKETKAPINSAAGSVGNLTSQFNDIGVMLAAGQNPLQLAIQQGTQIGQVFQSTGAKGKDAFKLLLQGATAMISPINLITIGTIAMGGALIQWLSSSSDEADHFAERLENAKAKIDELRFENRFLTSGLASPEELTLLDDARKARQELREAQAELADNQGPGSYPFELAVREAKERLAAAEANLTALRDAQGINKELTDEAKEKARLEEEARKRREQDLATAGEMLLSLQQENELTRIGLTFGEDSVMLERARADAARAAMERDLDGLTVSEDLKDSIRATLEEKLRLASVDIESGLGAGYRMAKALADELQRAVGAAISLSAQGIADMRTAEINWEYRDDPVGRAGALAGERFNTNLGDTTGFDPIVQEGLSQQRAEYVANAKAVEELRQKTIAWRKEQAEAGRAAGGAAKASHKEREAVKDLIASKRDELAILRESDPVQREMIRLREELAAATPKQREEIEKLIETYAAEELAKAQAAETSEFFRSSMADLIPDLVRGGDEAASAWQRMARSLEDAAWQALLLGEGPLMGLVNMLFGISGGGGGALGWIGKIFGLAEGGGHDVVGMHYGLGGPKADKIPILTSAGEFTVNARATQKHRPLLEAINAGAPIPGFADGGSHGGGSYSASPVEVQFELIDQTSRGLRIEREERSDGRQPRFIASDMVDDAINLRGGKARRSLRQKGLRDPLVRT